MRNFKKFLALVLAMLMVSACAVSVSAVYADQDAVNATGYAEAVDVLGTLGVMQGSGDGNFNPNGTLTRAEAAAVIGRLTGNKDRIVVLNAEGEKRFLAPVKGDEIYKVIAAY